MGLVPPEVPKTAGVSTSNSTVVRVDLFFITKEILFKHIPTRSDRAKTGSFGPMPRAFRSENLDHFNEAIVALRKDIVRRCGFEIQTVKECRILSNELEEFDRRFPLAVSTIRRFFSLIPSESEFSITTLNALARYADKPDFHFYLDTVHADHFDLKTQAWDAAIPDAFIGLPQTLPELLELVEAVPYARPKGPLIARLASALETLYSSREIPEHLWRPLNRSARGRSLTWEGFPPLDDLNGFGKEILTDYIACSPNPSDHVFASTLLSMGELFGGNVEEAERFVGKTPHVAEDAHPVVQGRLLGLHLLLSEVRADHKEIASLVETALQALSISSTAGEHTRIQPFSRLVLLTACQDLYVGLDECIGRMQKSPQLWVEAAPFLGALRLEWAWFAFLNGEKSVAWSRMRDLSGSCFPFFERKTSELYLHSLGAAIAPKEHERNDHAERARSVGAHLQYPWLQKRLADQIEAHF